MSIFDVINKTPINSYNLEKIGFQKLTEPILGMSGGQLSIDTSSWKVYFQKPVKIEERFIGFAIYDDGKLTIDDHLMSNPPITYSVDTIEDIIDIMELHGRKIIEDYKIYKSNYYDLYDVLKSPEFC